MTNATASTVRRCSARCHKSRILRSISRTFVYPLLCLSVLCSPKLHANESLVDFLQPPSRATVEEQLTVSGELDGLTGEQKAHKIDQLYRTLAQHHRLQLFGIRSACGNDLKKYCENSDPADLTCLATNHLYLEPCCTSNILQAQNKPGISASNQFGELSLPGGSEVLYNMSCDTVRVMLSGATPYKNVSLGPGEVYFDIEYNPITADLTHNQNYKGLILKGGPTHRVQFTDQHRIAAAVLAENSNYRGFSMKADTVVEFHLNGEVSRATLSEPSEFNGYKIQSGDVQFNEAGSLHIAKLAEALKSNHFVIAAGSTVAFNRLGELERATVQGDRAQGGLRPGYTGSVSVHPNGQPRLLATEHEPVIIDGRVYPSNTTLEFTKNGDVIRDSFRDPRLKNIVSFSMDSAPLGELTEDRAIGGIRFPAGSLIFPERHGAGLTVYTPSPVTDPNSGISASAVSFNSDFMAQSYLLGATWQLQEWTLKPGSKVHLDKKGIPRSVYILEPHTYNGNLTRGNQTVQLHPSGFPKKLRFRTLTNWIGNSSYRNVDVGLHPSGELKSIFLEEPLSVDSIEFDGNTVFFHTNGAVSSGVLNKPTNLQGVQYAAGTELLFSEAGEVIHSWAGRPRWKNGMPPQNANTDSKTVVSGVSVMSRRASSIRIPIFKLSPDMCEKMFPGYKDGKTKPASSGFSLGGSGQGLTPGKTGCGTTDKEAGILARDP